MSWYAWVILACAVPLAWGLGYRSGHAPYEELRQELAAQQQRSEAAAADAGRQYIEAQRRGDELYERNRALAMQLQQQRALSRRAPSGCAADPASGTGVSKAHGRASAADGSRGAALELARLARDADAAAEYAAACYRWVSGKGDYSVR